MWSFPLKRALQKASWLVRNNEMICASLAGRQRAQMEGCKAYEILIWIYCWKYRLIEHWFMPIAQGSQMLSRCVTDWTKVRWLKSVDVNTRFYFARGYVTIDSIKPTLARWRCESAPFASSSILLVLPYWSPPNLHWIQALNFSTSSLIVTGRYRSYLLPYAVATQFRNWPHELARNTTESTKNSEKDIFSGCLSAEKSTKRCTFQLLTEVV